LLLECEAVLELLELELLPHPVSTATAATIASAGKQRRKIAELPLPLQSVLRMTLSSSLRASRRHESVAPRTNVTVRYQETLSTSTVRFV
jgi:hypothetical protein